jgi:hypothetical protein
MKPSGHASQHQNLNCFTDDIALNLQDGSNDMLDPADVTDDLVPNFEDGSNDVHDPADVTDANAFEALSQGNNHSTATVPDPVIVNETLERQYIQIEAEILDESSTVVIDHFPFGGAGMPIPDRPHGSEPDQATHVDSVWAPFLSQHDWEIARWAKMHGPTSSALTELLALPEV